MSEFRKILVAIDFSLSSEKAANYAALLASDNGASVHLLHVIDSDYTLPGMSDLEKPAVETITARLSALCEKLKKERGITCSFSSVFGTVTHYILREAHAIKADMIVAGKTGANQSSSQFAGIHVCELVEKAPVPVLVVPAATLLNGVDRILFPVRPQLGVMSKYQMIKSLFLSRKPEFTLLSLRNPDSEQDLHIVTRIIHLLEQRLDHEEINYDTEYYFRDNNFADHILYFLKNRHYDLAIINAERDRTGKQFHVSQFVQTIIHRCTTPVLISYVDEAGLTKAQVLNQLTAVIP